ncbi:MAG: hypothetical protein M3394_00030 [Actinomycetota bacterium]|nr:hypothetical protein [Actinomycetota bacterium]
MAVDELQGVPWTRKHDEPGVPVRPSAARVVFPKSLEELIEVCAKHSPDERFRAVGSHWALSDAALSDTTFIETHDLDHLHQAMGKTLFDVVPGCLHDDFIAFLAAETVPPYATDQVHENAGFYPIHFETGKKIFQLYAELDHGHDDEAESLAVLLRDHHDNASYLGPWAFPTLGGAGGQTVFGAVNTGTHGGDFRFRPISDAVLAVHLVADGGKHFWIEPGKSRQGAPLTDEEKLRALFDDDKFRGNEEPGNARRNFDVFHDDDLFNAVVVSAGRFGAVYSVVMRAVRQYSLHEQRRLVTWQDVRGQVADINSDLFKMIPDPAPVGDQVVRSRFLQIAVCLTPHENFSKNLAGVTKRFNVPMALDPDSGIPSGRAERVGDMVEAFNTLIQAPRFANAGTTHAYLPDTAQPGSAADPSFIENACANADFVQGVLAEVIQEIEDFVNSNGTEIGVGLAAVTAATGGAGLALLAPLIPILALLAALAALFASQADPRLGQNMNDVKDQLLNNPDPAQRAAGLLVWQMIAFKVFESQQGDQDYAAISYAVMDGHDYLDQSCNINVDSIEVFFDATNPMLVAFVDALITFEIAQETVGKAFMGYASLRFTGRTRALIGEQRHPLTCVVEVAGLRDVTGTTELIDFATTLALDPNFDAVLHWGQRNEAMRSHIEFQFDGPLQRWRKALALITDDGRLDRFSSEFTRRTGLEVV